MSAPHGRGSPECRELFARLSDYLDGEVPAEIRAEIEGHLGACPPCEAFLESLRRTVGLVRDLPTPGLPEEWTEEFCAAYRKARM